MFLLRFSIDKQNSNFFIKLNIINVHYEDYFDLYETIHEFYFP